MARGRIDASAFDATGVRLRVTESEKIGPGAFETRPVDRPRPASEVVGFGHELLKVTTASILTTASTS